MIEKPDPDIDAGYKGIAGAPYQLAGVNEDFQVPLEYEVIFNTAGAENMNRAKVSTYHTEKLTCPLNIKSC